MSARRPEAGRRSLGHLAEIAAQPALVDVVPVGAVQEERDPAAFAEELRERFLHGPLTEADEGVDGRPLER